MQEQTTLRTQKIVVVVAITLFCLKLAAYLFTHSVAVLTDALESTVNIIAAFIGLYSIYLASLPRDKNHPYGHGKVEFLSAAIEGALIVFAGLVIVYKSIEQLFHPEALHSLDIGMILIGITALVNYGVGTYCVKKGEKEKSIALVASGKHLLTDTYYTLGVIGALIVIYFTHWTWFDASVSLIFACITIYMGYKIVRESISGIMDEADEALLESLAAFLEANRIPNWMDLHNVRVIKYGGSLHIDCHLTLPWYLNVHEAHTEHEKLTDLIRNQFGDSIEFFIHVDGCMPFCCEICNKQDCNERKSPFKQRVTWTVENIMNNEKHRLQ